MPEIKEARTRAAIVQSNPGGTSPLARGLITFLSFVAFGALPLCPYFVHPATAATFHLPPVATFKALISPGLLRRFATREPALRGAAETVLPGGISAVVDCGIGAMVAAL